MPVLVGRGDRLITRSGRESWLSRPSVPFSNMFGAGGSVRIAGGGRISHQQIYEQQIWAHIAVNKLSRQIARLPLKTYRLLDGSKSDGERTRVRRGEHPLPTLLAGPQPRRSALWLKQKAAHPSLVNGNALWAKGAPSNGAAPDTLIPLDWRSITPHTDDYGQVLFWETTQSGAPRRLAPDQVVHFAWEAGGGDIGCSPLAALGTTIRVEDAAQRYQASSFENGVRPSVVYVLPPEVELDPEEKAELRNSLQGQQGGVDKAFQLALISGGGKLETMQHTAVEAELIEQRRIDREEVAAAYDIPPPLIGILDHATYSNVAEMHRMLYGMVLGPWLVMIEETIQSQLIDAYEPWAREGLFVEFDLAEVLKGDTLKEVQAIKEAIATALLTPNEGRQIRNLPPSDQDGMDRFYLPQNNLTAVGSAPDDQDEPAAFAPVRRNLDRAADRVHRRGLDAVDLDRFERELAEDLDDTEQAAGWRQRVAECSTADEIRALTA